MQSSAGRSLLDDAIRRFLANRAAMVCLAILGFVTLACVLGPTLAPHRFDTIYPSYVKVPASLEAYPREEAIRPALERALRRARLQVVESTIEGGRIIAEVTSRRPIDVRVTRYVDRADMFSDARIESVGDNDLSMTLSAAVDRHLFLFGTDANGRDLFTRTLIAGRVSLLIGILASIVALIIGTAWGAVAGFLGGRVDMVMMRIVDVLYSLPFIFFVILLVVFFGRNFVLMFIAVGAVEWLDMARIVRGQTLSLKRREFVEAAHVLGVGTPGIILRHIIPNLMGPVVVTVTLLVPRVILLESFLSFLGLGVQEPMTSWGVLISEGARNLQGAPWMLAFPALILSITLFSLNFIGDGLRDAFDPQEH